MYREKNAGQLIFLMVFLCIPLFGHADPFSIVQRGHFITSRAPLFLARLQTNETMPETRGASLFIGQDRQSLFAPFIPRRERAIRHFQSTGNATRVERLRAIIGRAESGQRGYDAIQHGAVILPGKRPTQLTIGEIFEWIDNTPGQQHAIGHYQFIPSTLRRLVTKLGVNRFQIFTPKIQDQLGDILLAEAGLNALNRGEIERHVFMHNLARIWAGLPTSTGRSYYEGVAGNHASMTWAHFDQEMSRIFPD